MFTKTTVRLAAAIGVFVGLSAGMPLGAALAHADGIEEDQPGWSCVDDGNRVCGPNNPEGKPAACYDEGGVIVALWPCEPHTGSGARPGPA